MRLFCFVLLACLLACLLVRYLVVCLSGEGGGRCNVITESNKNILKERSKYVHTTKIPGLELLYDRYGHCHGTHAGHHAFHRSFVHP